jgi:hypothetical protein
MHTHATYWGLTDFDGMRLRLWTAITNGHVVHPPDDTNLEEEGGMMMTGETPIELEEKPVPVPLCPSQIPLGLTRARTRFSAVRGLRLTAWAIARPFLRFGSTSPSVRHYANRLSLDFSFETRENESQHTNKSKSQNFAHTSVTRKMDNSCFWHWGLFIYSFEILFILYGSFKDANGGSGYIGIMDQFNVIPRNIRSRVLRKI